MIPAGLLANGGSIAQAQVDEAIYYHLELPRHDVLMAESLPVESFLDTGNRDNFDNGGATRLFPDFAVPQGHAAMIWEAEGCAPLILSGRRLEAARKALDRRAATLVSARGLQGAK